MHSASIEEEKKQAKYLYILKQNKQHKIVNCMIKDIGNKRQIHFIELNIPNLILKKQQKLQIVL